MGHRSIAGVNIPNDSRISFLWQLWDGRTIVHSVVERRNSHRHNNQTTIPIRERSLDINMSLLSDFLIPGNFGGQTPNILATQPLMMAYDKDSNLLWIALEGAWSQVATTNGVFSGNYANAMPTFTPQSPAAIAFDNSTGRVWNWFGTTPSWQ